MSRYREMVKKESIVDRREYERYNVSNDASVLLRNGNNHVGQLLNISIDGLALSYVSGDKRIEGWFHIYLFSREKFFLKNIPLRVVSDSLIEDTTILNTLVKKRCGGQFGKLTPFQRSCLDHFIANHTAG